MNVESEMTGKLARRDFLKAAGAVAAVGVGSGEAVAAEPWRMKLSASSIGFSSLSIEKACARISALGFEAIDIWSAHAGCPHLDDVLDRLGPDGLESLLAEHDLKLFAFSVYKGGYAKYAKLLGESGGGVAVHGSAGMDKDAGLTAQMGKYMESLKPELDLAEKHNSYVAIENHVGSKLLNSLDSLKAFVDVNTSPRLGIALAPYHLQKIKVSVPEAIRVCGKQLHFFYAWQNHPDTQQLPGIGPTDMKPWLKALADIKYKGYVNPFMHHEPEPDKMSAALKKSRAHLKKCFNEISKRS